MSDFECYECGTVTADDERVWIATKCVCGEGEDCAECGYDVCMKCEDMCNKREAEDGNAREYDNDEEERKLIAAYLDSFLNKRGKGGGKRDCHSEDEQDDMKSHPCECGVEECPDCFPKEEDEKEYTCGEKCECTHCQRNRPTYEEDGDGFVICSKCGKGGGKCDGDCEESK